MQVTLNIVAVILIGVAILVIGNFLGLMEGRGQGYKKRKKEEEQEAKTRGAFEASLPPPSPLVDNSLLKLSLDDNNQLCLDMDGERVDTSQLAPDQRKRLVDLMVTMRPWIEASAPSKPASGSQPVLHSMAAPTPSLSKPVPPSTTVQTTPPAAPSSQPGAAPAAPTSMVGQIDAILQRKLIGTSLASLGIRLIESPEGGVTVMVGLNRYAGVGDVPNPEVQTAIKAAIAEWEKKYTPGA
jgi:hypothetical protein